MAPIYDPIITKVYLWQNNMVMVFDQYGQQMPDYQGTKEDVWEMVVRDAPPDAVFQGGIWRSMDLWTIERQRG